jgi:hypothetical protein
MKHLLLTTIAAVLLATTGFVDPNLKNLDKPGPVPPSCTSLASITNNSLTVFRAATIALPILPEMLFTIFWHK